MISPAVRVAVLDQFGHTYPTDTVSVTVALGANAVGAVLTGTKVSVTAAGVATFSDLRISRPSNDLALLATAASLIDGSSPPFRIALTMNAISAGGLHTCGLNISNHAWCWGNNVYGQLGDGDTTTVSLVPTLVSDSLRFLQLSAGFEHSCAVTIDSLAYCWGRNESGQLGDGTPTDRNRPTPVAGGLKFVQVGTRQDHSCGVTADSLAYCWGRNDLGELGDSTNTPRPTPTLVAGGLRFGQISVGLHTCGITRGNAAYCWGRDVEGQLGDGSPVYHRDAPTLVVGGLSFLSISAGDFHTCALTTTQAAYCWGQGWANSPAAVPGALAFAELDAGGSHTCGTTMANVGYCWGDNTYGKLGDGTTDGRAAPTAVTGGLSFTVLNAGLQHTCGITTDQVSYCWGYNFYGGVGDGTITLRYSPTRIVQ